MDSMSRLQAKNSRESQRRYRIKKLSSILPEMQERNVNQYDRTEYNSHQRARSKSAEPMNR